MHKAPSIFLSLGHQTPMCFLGMVFFPTSACCCSPLPPLATPSWTPSSPPSLFCGTVKGERNREGPGLLSLRRTLLGKTPRVEGVWGVGGGFSKVDSTSSAWPRLCPLTESNVRCMIAAQGQSMGTSPTKHQAKILRLHSDEIDQHLSAKDWFAAYFYSYCPMLSRTKSLKKNWINLRIRNRNNRHQTRDNWFD